ncbi:MAG: hypothetical protein KKF24_10365 [Gammaproteobacteria bacterium]|nr:EF-hand domain-containing protein [Zhongshania sp.]MBU0537361.1 hypothetical protein [Gammaproteobacteria bacterium]MBU1833088.1 hypothetical protein [Gammaproteobacteria bacterium]
MKKIAAVFAGVALSSFCFAAPMSGTVQDTGVGASQGDVNTNVQQDTQQGGSMGSGMGTSTGTQTQGTMQGSGDASSAIFTALDQNGDGSLDEKEAKSEQSLTQYFTAIDANADGTVSRDEYMSRRQAIQDHEEEAE